MLLQIIRKKKQMWQKNFIEMQPRKVKEHILRIPIVLII